MKGKSLIALLLGIVWCSTLMCGCAMKSPPAADRSERARGLIQPIVWPARWMDDLEGVAGDLQDAVWFEFAEPIQRPVLREGETAHVLAEAMMLYEYTRTEVRGKGIVRETSLPRRRGVRVYRSETGTYEWPINPDTENERTSERPYRLQFISFHDEPDADDVEYESLGAVRMRSTSRMSLVVPADGEMRGLAITLGPHSQARWNLRHRLPERGWAVLHLGMTHPLQLPERLSFSFDHETSPAEAARVIAETVDEQIAEYAYAAEAALAQVREHVSEVTDAPVAVIGLSRGALIAQAVAARLGDEVDHVVLALGGANLLRIAKTTTFRNHGLLTMTWLDANGRSRSLSRAEREALFEAYLEFSQLDPYRVAPHLYGHRVLVISAALDHIVPASTGRVLRERLGEPERWHYPAGHALTGWILNSKADRIIDWLEGE